MRRKFGHILNKLANKDEKIVLLVGDIGYGILYEIVNKSISLVGKPLSWVHSGDQKLDQYTFNTGSIEDIQIYTREAAEAARAKANEIF